MLSYVLFHFLLLCVLLCVLFMFEYMLVVIELLL